MEERSQMQGKEKRGAVPGRRLSETVWWS